MFGFFSGDILQCDSPLWNYATNSTRQLIFWWKKHLEWIFFFERIRPSPPLVSKQNSLLGHAEWPLHVFWPGRLNSCGHHYGPIFPWSFFSFLGSWDPHIPLTILLLLLPPLILLLSSLGTELCIYKWLCLQLLWSLHSVKLNRHGASLCVCGQPLLLT